MKKIVSKIGIIIFLVIVFVILSFFNNIYKKYYFNDFVKAESNQNITIFSRDNDNKYSEKDSYKIESVQFNDAMFYKDLNVIPNTPYRLTCMVKTDNVKTQNVCSIGGAHISIMGTLEQSESIVETNDWQPIELMFNSKNRTQIQIGFRLGGNNEMCKGTAWFSDFKLEIGTAETNTKWNMACFIIKNVDIQIPEKNIDFKLSMKPSDITTMKGDMERFSKACNELSNNNMTVNYDIYEIDKPLTSVSYSEEFEYFVAPSDVKCLINEYLKKTEYDHIFICVRLGDIEKNLEIPVRDWIGLGGMTYNNIGFSNIRLPNESNNYVYTYNPNINTFPEEVFLHEFLHSLEATLISYDYDIPALHDNEIYGYKDQKLIGLKEWYNAYMTCKIKDTSGKYIGLDRIVYTQKPLKKENFNYPVGVEFNKEPENIIEEIISFINTIKQKFTRSNKNYESI